MPERSTASPAVQPAGTSSSITVCRPASAHATTIAMRSTRTEHLPRAAREHVDKLVADALERATERERADYAAGREPDLEVRTRAGSAHRREVPASFELVERPVHEAHGDGALGHEPVYRREARAREAARQSEPDRDLTVVPGEDSRIRAP